MGKYQAYEKYSEYENDRLYARKGNKRSKLKKGYDEWFSENNVKEGDVL